MREISTEKIKIGEHVMIDGVEYVVEKAGFGNPCEGCAFDDCSKPCSSFIECEGIVYVKVKKEPKYRPYKDTDEMIADWQERFKSNDQPLYSMPLIWVKGKNGFNHLITDYLITYVKIDVDFCYMPELFGEYTYLDGTPCGKEVTE